MMLGIQKKRVLMKMSDLLKVPGITKFAIIKVKKSANFSPGSGKLSNIG